MNLSILAGRKKSLGLSSLNLTKGEMPRIIVVSNRLPITVVWNKSAPNPDDQYTFKMSSGGLVAGLEGISKKSQIRFRIFNLN